MTPTLRGFTPPARVDLADFTMYDAPFRFYAPNPGRWHSPDPLGGDITNPQSLNRYAMC